MAAPSAAQEAEAPQSPELEAATRAVAELRDLEAIVEAAVEEAQQEAETAPPAPPPHTAPCPCSHDQAMRSAHLLNDAVPS